MAQRGIRTGPNQAGHRQEETHKQDLDSARAISAPETAGARWRP